MVGPSEDASCYQFHLAAISEPLGSHAATAPPTTQSISLYKTRCDAFPPITDLSPPLYFASDLPIPSIISPRSSCCSHATTAAEVTVSAAAATVAATKCHMLKIEGYKRIKTIYGNGRGIDSCGFEAAGRTWKIQFFPDGNRIESTGFVSIVLKLEDDATVGAAAGNDNNILVELRFSLVCHADKPARRPYGVTYTTTFNKGRKAFGCGHFIRREDLEKSEFLRDDCLAVRCDIAVLNNPADVKEQAAQVQDLERLGVVCHCKDDMCKGYHARGAAASSFREAIVKLFLGCFHL